MPMRYVHEWMKKEMLVGIAHANASFLDADPGAT